MRHHLFCTQMQEVAAPAPETFVLRVYDPQGPSNYVVRPLERIHGQLHRLDLGVASGVTITPNAVYQIYPNRPGHCFYDALPAGARWHAMTKTATGWQQQAVIDAHDYYAYFTIPAGTTELRWVRASSQVELKNSLL